MAGIHHDDERPTMLDIVRECGYDYHIKLLEIIADDYPEAFGDAFRQVFEADIPDDVKHIKPAGSMDDAG